LPDNSEAWFAEKDEQMLTLKELVPDKNQCIGFDIPLVLSADGRARKPYLIDIYEDVSFLGDLNRQIAEVPDGGKIALRIKPPS
jgi:hypothetical protein